LGQANGTFGAAAAYETGAGSRPTGLAIADLNADGKPDVVTANLGTNDVSVLLGNGDGTFGPALHFATGPSPVAVTGGDFNGDDNLALAVASNSGSDPLLNLLLGNGDGTFGPAANYTDGGGVAVVAADFNHDGNLDVASSRSGRLRVYFGNGDGTLGAPPTYGGRGHSIPPPPSH